MTLPPERKEKKVEVPPLPPETYPKYLPPTEGVPQQILDLINQPETIQGGQPSLMAFIAWWKAMNPQGLYEMQLADYLRTKLNKGLARIEAEYQAALVEKLGEYETEKSRATKAVKERDEAEARLEKEIKDTNETVAWYKKPEMGQPVENMPFYNEIKAQGITYEQSPSVQTAYNRYKRQVFLEQQAEAQQQQQFEQDYARWEKQQELSAAQYAAQGLTLGSRRYYEAQQAAEKQAAVEQPAWRRGMRASAIQAVYPEEDVFGGEVILGARTKYGMSEEEAKQVFTLPAIRTGGGGERNLVNMINQARQAGIDTTGWEQEIERTARTGGDAALGRMAVNLNDEIQRVQQNQRAQQSSFYQQQYPGEYAAWAGKQQAGGANWDPTGFAQWVNQSLSTTTPREGEELGPEQVAFQTKVRGTELESWRKYGDIYGEYSDYLSGAPEYKPIEKWIEETPQVKLEWERRNQPGYRRQPYAQWR